jgi:ABC-2 type transport system permease protein
MNKLYSIAVNTFLETIRQPVYGVILLTTAGLLVLNLGLAMFSLTDDNKVLQDLGLSTMLLSGLFLAAFSATGVLTREIENKTVLTVVSKPVGRPQFIFGKFLGIALALSVAFFLCALVFFLTIRNQVFQTARDPYDFPVMIFGFGALFAIFLVGAFCNYFYGTSFQSFSVLLAVPVMSVAVAVVGFVGKEWKIVRFGEGMFAPQITIAVVLVFLAVLVLAAVAIAASTRLGQVMTLLICSGVLMLGITSDYLFGRYRDSVWVADVLYRITPNFGYFWVSDALIAEHEISLGYLGITSSYAVCYILGVLLIGVALFQKRELG